MRKVVVLSLLLSTAFLSAAEMVTVTEGDGAYTLSVTTTAGSGKTARDSRSTAPFILTALKDGVTVHRAAVALTPDREPGTRTGRIYLPDGLAWSDLALYRVIPERRNKPLATIPVAALRPLARLDRSAARSLSLAEPLYPFEKIQETGPDKKRLVLVVLGDGYTAAEMEKFKSDVQAALDGLFGVPPWDKRRGAFNIYRVDVVSKESGADHLESDPPTYADTALGANYGCFNTARLICIDEGTVQGVAASVAAYDFALVIVNDPTYGGSGGTVTVASTHATTIDLVLHEFGHTFGKLADEYEDYYDYPAGDSEPNVSYAYDFDREQIKWGAWIEEDTLLPTPENEGYYDLVGMFEGARYQSTGIYRPKENCEMRALGHPFCPVCIEAQTLQMYNYAPPLNGVAPAAGTVAYEPGLTVTVNALPCDAITVDFTLNGVPVTGADCAAGVCSLPLTADGMKSGNNTLLARIADTTGEIRTDPEYLSASTVQWKIVYDGPVVDEDMVDEDTIVTDPSDQSELSDGPDLSDGSDDDIPAKKDDGCSCAVVEF